MGALNWHFKQKWIRDLQREPYNLPKEKAKQIMDEIDKEATEKLLNAIHNLSKRLDKQDWG